MRNIKIDKIEKLKLIIKLYYEGKYDIDTFADLFSYTYNVESNNNCNKKQLEYYKELYIVTSRYSPYKEDLISYPDVYFSKEDVLNVLKKMKRC